MRSYISLIAQSIIKEVNYGGTNELKNNFLLDEDLSEDLQKRLVRYYLDTPIGKEISIDPILLEGLAAKLKVLPSPASVLEDFVQVKKELDQLASNHSGNKIEIEEKIVAVKTRSEDILSKTHLTFNSLDSVKFVLKQLLQPTPKKGYEDQIDVIRLTFAAFIFARATDASRSLKTGTISSTYCDTLEKVSDFNQIISVMSGAIFCLAQKNGLELSPAEPKTIRSIAQQMYDQAALHYRAAVQDPKAKFDINNPTVLDFQLQDMSKEPSFLALQKRVKDFGGYTQVYKNIKTGRVQTVFIFEYDFVSQQLAAILSEKIKCGVRGKSIIFSDVKNEELIGLLDFNVSKSDEESSLSQEFKSIDITGNAHTKGSSSISSSSSSSSNSSCTSTSVSSSSSTNTARTSVSVAALVAVKTPKKKEQNKPVNNTSSEDRQQPAP